MTKPTTYTALVLAGSREKDDPIATSYAGGIKLKTFVPVGGVPMLVRVLKNVLASPYIGRVIVCLPNPSSLDTIAELSHYIAEKKLLSIPTEATPVLSVLSAIEMIKDPLPLLVTTGDHPLLTPPMINYFIEHLPEQADFVVALAAASLITQHYPKAIRTFYKFMDDGYSGCNLFALLHPNAANVGQYWLKMEKHRKKPWQLIKQIGPMVLLKFLRGKIDLPTALSIISKKTNADIRHVLMPFAEAAIDIDKPEDLILVEQILANQQQVLN
ncbi:MAG: nucleotidyltransferase family protein [Alphaproteobacteria bacterium]|nr:nucleotidyltransferase family protein [Alphaproteobacteria bacterium]